MRRGVSVSLLLHSTRFRLAELSTVYEKEAPSGMLSRGHYNAKTQFIDDDNASHLKFEWSFDIAKDW